MGKLVGSVDQGTSSTRFILFDEVRSRSRCPAPCPCSAPRGIALRSRAHRTGAFGLRAERRCPAAPQDGKIVEKHQIELPNIYPQEGWCEHDPAVIMDAVTTCIEETMKKVEGRFTAADVAAIGVR